MNSCGLSFERVRDLGRGTSRRKPGWSTKGKAEATKTETEPPLVRLKPVFDRGPWGVATISLVTSLGLIPIDRTQTGLKGKVRCRLA
jgi:hypothetical protein